MHFESRLLCLLFAATPLLAQQPEPTTAGHSVAALAQSAFVEIAKKTRPSLVSVRAFERVPAAAVDAAATTAPKPEGWVETAPPDYPGFRMFSSGSGFVVAENGDILTCTHLVQKEPGVLADLVDVELADGSRVIAEVVGMEPTVNFAILQPMVFPNGHDRNLPPLQFGDSDVMQCGQWVVGMGDPAGPEKFFTVGSFVALPQRDCYQDLLSAFFMQVAMIAHPEAYGGPVLDLSGKVIGILAPRKPLPGGKTDEPRWGIEYAMPSKIVAGLYDSIRTARSFRSPWLGYAVISRAEIAKERGLEAYQAMDKPKAGIMLENVYDPSPAKAAGLQPGDWLVGFDATRIFTPVDFQKCLYLAGIDKEVELEFYRGGETFKRKLTIEVRPAGATPR